MFDERFDRLRANANRRHQCDWVEFERDLDQLQDDVRAEDLRNQARFETLQAELAELLRRVPAPDTTPATIVVTAH